MSSQESKVILEASNIKKYFPSNKKVNGVPIVAKAVDGVSITLNKGEIYGMVGESGCGKSTFGRTILRLLKPTEGKIVLDGKDITNLKEDELRKYRAGMQMIFQDPYTSLNPRKRVGDILEEVLIIHGMKDKQERMDMVLSIMDQVGLRKEHYYRFPHEFSGGQRQRIGIARALILKPEFIVCDEPVSALDVSIQSQIINLLLDLQQEKNLTYLFIAHDLSVVKYISTRIGVMYLGRLVEEAPTDELFANPVHPYTQALLSAVPSIDVDIKKQRIILKGDIPSPLNPPKGCTFHTRCPYASDICKEKSPEMLMTGNGHRVACHQYRTE